MPVTLEEVSEAVKLRGLKWVCCDCLAVNRPTQVECCNCGKQRWVQLGLGAYDARALAAFINEEGHGL